MTRRVGPGAFPLRRFVLIGQKAVAGDDFLLDDLPGTSGRLDVLVRCLRPAFLSSHGVRRGVVVYLVLLGGPRAPRVVRVDGRDVKFLRPDERALATLLKKSLASRADERAPRFAGVKPGISVARGGLEVALDDALAAPGLPGDEAATALYVLDEGASDVRNLPDLGGMPSCFVIGDHLGIPDDARALLGARGATPVSVGPVSVHADDVVTLLTNELDRADARRHVEVTGDVSLAKD